MARKKVREYDAKRLLTQFLHEKGIDVAYKGVLVEPSTNLNSLAQDHVWLQETKLVAKPDQLFGKRKKHNLVLVNATLQEVIQFIEEHRQKEVTIGKATGQLTHFLIEPFVAHEKEYYVAIVSEREKDMIYFSEQGGIDIEENWDNVVKIAVPTLEKLNIANMTGIAQNVQCIIAAIYEFAVEYDFSYLEINPLTFDAAGNLHLLDCVAQADDCASYKNQQKWQGLSFPKEFGKKSYAEEDYIADIDRNSGASLKLTVLNPKGRIWNILGGGGASIIYLDMIANLGKGNEIANYGESSGNPSTAESYEYAKMILQLMTKEKDERGKVLFIVGGIANFTDVKDTFKGFIQALEEFVDLLREHKVSVFVRRGGPNYEAGLTHIKQVGEKLGLPMQVYGPETSMPKIIEIAREAL